MNNEQTTRYLNPRALEGELGEPRRCGSRGSALREEAALEAAVGEAARRTLPEDVVAALGDAVVHAVAHAERERQPQRRRRREGQLQELRDLQHRLRLDGEAAPTPPSSLNHCLTL
jgi:hypothetical protein